MPDSTASLYIGLMTALRQRLTAPDFLERHRQSVKAFTRQRCLPFVTMVLFLVNLVKRPLQDELDQFLNLENEGAVAAPRVTQSAFSQARKKLKAEAFIELNTVQVDYFDNSTLDFRGLQQLGSLIKSLRKFALLRSQNAFLDLGSLMLRNICSMCHCRINDIAII